MENGLCGAGAALFLYGLLSLYRLTRWSRARVTDDEASGDPPPSRVRRLLGRHGEFGACGLLLAATTAGFYLIVRALLDAAELASAGALSAGLAAALGAVTTISCTQAFVDLARSRSRCADLECAALGAFRKIATLDEARRTSDLRLLRALREKEEAEALARRVAEGEPPAPPPVRLEGVAGAPRAS